MIYTNKINSQIPIRTLNLRYLIILVVSFLTISILDIDKKKTIQLFRD